MIALLLLTLCVPRISSEEWSYDGEHGPSHWSGVCNLDTSTRQSPIDVQTPSDPSSYDSFPSFSFSGYENINGKLENNGHTVVISLTSGEPLLAGGGLEGTYRLAQFHFHWGSKDSQGSEHTIDERRYPMEVHFVHYNTKYGSVSVAADKADGLAVLGWMFTIDRKNKAYKTIFNRADQLAPHGTTYQLNGLNIRDFMGDAGTYFRYLGSLTTPACYESVTWTVFEKPIPISNSQMQKIRGVLASTPGTPEVPMADNFRPIQPTNGREIFYNKDE